MQEKWKTQDCLPLFNYVNVSNRVVFASLFLLIKIIKFKLVNYAWNFKRIQWLESLKQSTKITNGKIAESGGLKRLL